MSNSNSMQSKNKFMRLRKTVAIAFLPVAALLSCKKSFLDAENPSQVYINSYYKDSASLAGVLTGAYNALQREYGTGSGGGLYLVGDVATDNSSSLVSSVPNWD